MISGLYHPRLVMSQDLRNPSRTLDSCDGNSRWFWHPKLFSWFTDQRSFVKMIYHYHMFIYIYIYVAGTFRYIYIYSIIKMIYHYHMFICIYYHCYIRYNRMTYHSTIYSISFYPSWSNKIYGEHLYFWSTTHGVSTPRLAGLPAQGPCRWWTGNPHHRWWLSSAPWPDPKVAPPDGQGGWLAIEIGI